jgi:class 3 adenylate cyclase
MATFASPDRAIAAALRMREAMAELNRRTGREEMLLKIGIHEGPCIAVSMNERQDYFGQTVNIASRVQSAAENSAIFVTGAVVENDRARALLSERRVVPEARNVVLRGIDRDFQIYALP